jgi:hypothetical protein
MHEVAIAQELVRGAEAAARDAGLLRVSRMSVELGARAGLSPHALSFALDLARAGTLAAGAEVIFDGPGALTDDDEAHVHGDEDHDHGHDYDHDHEHVDPADSDVRLAWIEGT